MKELKESLASTPPAGALVTVAKTMDQARALLTFVEAISEKTLRSTVALTAARGRGKSAALGLAIAAAVGFGYANIFVTSPSPENLKTVFEFIFKGFDCLEYEEHLDYDIVQSTNPDFRKAIVRVNIFRSHRQTIQYIQPQDAHTLGQAELLVIDEAAAIPLPLVRQLLGPYLVFMSSTINGYEGTGRSLSLKLIQQLREQSRGFVGKKVDADPSGAVVGRDGKARKETSGIATGGRTLREIKLEEPIRYNEGDSVETWLNKLLCLDASIVPRHLQGCPHPKECDLYYVNRDTLFSYHPVSEAFLQKMMALYVASHYKNSPNDLQLMSDAPAHSLFVLLPPVKKEDSGLPEPVCVIQVCLEGEISRESVMKSLGRGQRAGGDLIPWLVSQQFQEEDFASLSGARVVRIATHPDYMKMGYGSRALELICRYYQGEFEDSDIPEGEKYTEEATFLATKETLADGNLLKEEIKIRDPKKMPPLLLRPGQIKAPRLHWVGVSYGLTASLHRFWKRSGFSPVYLRQTANELTGEHTSVMLKALNTDDMEDAYTSEWLTGFCKDFRKRFLALLAYEFKSFQTVLALSILEAAGQPPANPHSIDRIKEDMTVYDVKRLEAYGNNMLDHHIVMDLVPVLSGWYFTGQLALELSGVQQAVLAGVGLQKKSINAVATELNLPHAQVLAMFVKICRKFSMLLRQQQEKDIEKEMDKKDSWDTAEKQVLEGKNVVTVATEKELSKGDTVKRIAQESTKKRKKQVNK